MNAADVLAIVMAIWIAEGGDNTRHPYGIMIGTKDPRRVCMNTVCNQWERWNGKSCFINSLADRYCPPQADPRGNVNWRRNVKALIGHETCRCRKTRGTLDRPAWFPATESYRKALSEYRKNRKVVK